MTGRQGHQPAGRQGGHHRELRAHPPLEPDRYGRHPAAVPPRGESHKSLGLDGTETFDISGIEELNEGKTPPKTVHVTATKEDGSKVEFDAKVRIDTPPGEADYYRNGGILQYVLRNMIKS